MKYSPTARDASQRTQHLIIVYNCGESNESFQARGKRVVSCCRVSRVVNLGYSLISLSVDGFNIVFVIYTLHLEGVLGFGMWHWFHAMNVLGALAVLI